MGEKEVRVENHSTENQRFSVPSVPESSPSLTTREGAAVFIRWFSELSSKDVNVAGNKGANLAEMYNNKFPVPPGFVITTDAYKYFIEKNSLQKHLMNILNETNINDANALEKNAAKIRSLIENAKMPGELEEEILEAYGVLDVEISGRAKIKGASEQALDILKAGHEPPFVAVRSSVTIEEVEEENFPGKQDTFLNVKGNKNLIDNVKKSFASLFSTGSICYREEKGLAHEQTYPAIIVQRMIDANKSGVIFSKNPLKTDNNILIKAIFGFGEGLDSEKIEPDNYFVNDKLDLVDSSVSNKKIAVVRNSAGDREIIRLGSEISRKEVLTGYEIKMLSQFAKRLEEYYGEPQDVEFAIDNDKIYLVQTRPVVFSETEEEKVEDKSEEEKEGMLEREEKVEKDNTENQRFSVSTTSKSSPSLAIEEEVIDEEELILKALESGEDEYSPSLKKGDDVPPLNEAIPIDSEQFKDNREEIIDLEEEKEKDDEIDEMLPEAETDEKEDLEDKKEYYEQQMGNIFDREIEKEVEDSEIREKAVKELIGKTEGQEGDKKEEVLDIF